MSIAYARYFQEDKLDVDYKTAIYDDGDDPRSGRRAGNIRVFFGLLVFILLAVILGFAAHNSSALSSWHRHQIRQEKKHENLTSTVMELQARFDNLTEMKKDTYLEEGPCSLGWVEVNRKCYYMTTVGETKNWFDSKTDCVNRGGRLVTIKTMTELQVLGVFHDRAWIGLSDRNAEGTWLWEDGTELQSSFWLKGEPNDSEDNEDCVHLTAIGKKLGFNDNHCEVELSYICETLG